MNTVLQTLKTLNDFCKSKNITAEISYHEELSHLVRAGAGQVSANTTKGNSQFYLNLQNGKREISASIATSPDQVDVLRSKILELNDNISFVPEIESLTPMKPLQQEITKTDALDRGVREFNKEMIVALFKKVGDYFGPQEIDVSGAFSAGGSSYALINTLVSEPLSHQGSDFDVEVVLQLKNDNNKELRAAQTGGSLKDFSADKIFNDLVHQYELKKTTTRTDITPGEYDVVFTADAIGVLLGGVGWIGLSGESFEYEMGMIPKSENPIGKKFFSDKLTIVDLPTDQENLFNRPIARTGVKRSTRNIIENGHLNHLYYSEKKTADLFNKEVNDDMDVASLKVMPGNGPSTFDELIKTTTKKTILITFVHYLNFTNAAKGEFTGTSRFGTYLIENGKVTNHLYNLRLNDSFFNIFGNIEWLSKDLTNISGSNTYGARIPSGYRIPNYTKVNGVKITATSGSSAKK